MLRVDEDSNDELFRKAAENYSTDKWAPQWNNVLAKMNNPSLSPEARNKQTSPAVWRGKSLLHRLWKRVRPGHS